MHLIDIANVQPCLQNKGYMFGSQTLLYKKLVYGDTKRFPYPWISFSVPQNAKNFKFGRIEVSRVGLVIRGVATLECAQAAWSGEEQDEYQNLRMGNDSSRLSSAATEQSSLGEDSAELNEREKLRRMRISKANKGNTPWNKGKKHTPETVQRIKERTRLAMQDPKVKMKLVNLGHAQSEETRIKIGLGVRMGWKKRREKLMLQETCYYEWQNLIAEASRKGLGGEKELQWDSYKILDKQLKQEWLQSVEQRKKMPRVKGSKRAPKSPEQRRKISEAIAAKWADPEYRSRVTSGLAKYHGIPEGVERKPRRKLRVSGETRKRSPAKKKVNDAYEFSNHETKSQIQRIKLKKNKAPQFRDPLASSKLEMLKSIRAQRAAAENKKLKAIARAKALIAEAEKAAKALETAAEKSPLAHASLIEARKLIAEATESIVSIEIAELDYENATSSDLVINSKEEVNAETAGLNQIDHKNVNGTEMLGTSMNIVNDLDFDKFALHNMLNSKSCSDLPLCSKNYVSPNGKINLSLRSSDFGPSPEEVNNMLKHFNFAGHSPDPEPNWSEQNTDSLLPNGSKPPSDEGAPKSINVTKRWIRGRLVEVVEEGQNK